MSRVSNIQKVDYTTDSTSTGQWFNNMYDPKKAVNGDAVGALQTYFETVTKNKSSAEVLTTAVVYTALAQNIDPMAVLAEFKKQTPGQLNAYLAAFINLARYPTSLLGVKNQPFTNKYVERTLLV